MTGAIACREMIEIVICHFGEPPTRRQDGRISPQCGSTKISLIRGILFLPTCVSQSNAEVATNFLPEGRQPPIISTVKIALPARCPTFPPALDRYPRGPQMGSRLRQSRFGGQGEALFFQKCGSFRNDCRADMPSRHRIRKPRLTSAS